MDALLSSPRAAEALEAYGRETVKEGLRRAIAAGRSEPEEIYEEAFSELGRRFAPSLARVINGTGVLLHTNLGRAPLSRAARLALERAAEGYASLEYDTSTGTRGSRQDHVRAAARDLFGAEDALLVNNNAAAIFLALAALARNRRVLISRGELVAIGGSFKIPEILEASGARLAEVGTTNRTTVEDYRQALSPEVGLLLSVHPSNYEIRGYARRAAPGELASLARESGIPWVHDQGTGCVVSLAEFGVAEEPTVADCLAGGADLVTFSGDKLFAGPQAGFAVGKADFVARLSSHPIARAVRPDKLTLAATGATLAAWKTGRWREFPVYRAAAAEPEELERRGAALCSSAAASGIAAEVVASAAVFGGGTSPEKTFPSRAVGLRHESLPAERLAERLRKGSPPIIGRVEKGRLLLDLRSIAPEEDEAVGRALEGVGPKPEAGSRKPGAD
jgi:L-seryl-tRNA(Ser) seleniumtransferase